MRPRRGGLLRIYSALVFRCLVFYWIAARRDDRRKEPPRPAEAKPTEPPAPLGVGGMGGVGWGGTPGAACEGASRRRHDEAKARDERRGRHLRGCAGGTAQESQQNLSYNARVIGQAAQLRPRSGAVRAT